MIMYLPGYSCLLKNSFALWVFMEEVCMIVPWLRQRVAFLSLWKPGFDPKPGHMGFVMDKVELELVSRRVL
jgi:hypothetical protein